jgi:hypothetical protein
MTPVLCALDMGEFANWQSQLVREEPEVLLSVGYQEKPASMAREQPEAVLETWPANNRSQHSRQEKWRSRFSKQPIWVAERQLQAKGGLDFPFTYFVV